MLFRKRGFRAMVLGLLVATGLALTPAAFAHSSWSVGINVPVGVGYYGPSYGYYGPTYYRPAYYDPYYYDPYYYGPSVVYYSGGHRYYRHHRYYDHHRYYRDGYYHH